MLKFIHIEYIDTHTCLHIWERDNMSSLYKKIHDNHLNDRID